MLLEFCVGKIHRATVTGADLNYQGSITIDEELVRAAGFFAGQKVIINNLSNGDSWFTYIVLGKKNRGEVVLNGPPARHFQKGDLVIILAYGLVDSKEAKDFSPIVIHVDGNNKITKTKKGYYFAKK